MNPKGKEEYWKDRDNTVNILQAERNTRIQSWVNTRYGFYISREEAAPLVNSNPTENFVTRINGSPIYQQLTPAGRILVDESGNECLHNNSSQHLPIFI